MLGSWSVLKNSTICDFHVELPNDAICFHNKKMHKFRFRLVKGRLLVQKKLKAIPMKKCLGSKLYYGRNAKLANGTMSSLSLVGTSN